jgi:hypothetical protein
MKTPKYETVPKLGGCILTGIKQVGSEFLLCCDLFVDSELKFHRTGFVAPENISDTVKKCGEKMSEVLFHYNQASYTIFNGVIFDPGDGTCESGNVLDGMALLALALTLPHEIPVDE